MHARYFDITFFFSLACSLAINGAMVSMVVLHTRPPAHLTLSNWRAASLSGPASPVAPQVEQDFPLPDDNPIPPPPPKKTQLDNRQAFGENGGTGNALNSQPGQQPMQATQGSQIQALLARNASQGGRGGGGGGAASMIGASGPIAAATPRVTVPTPKFTPAHRPPAPQRPAPRAVASAQHPQSSPPQPPKTNKLAGKGTSTDKQPPITAMGDQPTPQPAPAPVVVAANIPVPSQSPPPDQAVQSQPQPQPQAQPQPQPQPMYAVPNNPGNSNSNSPPGKPGPPGTPGEIANPSDTESDPFSDANSFKFVNGRVSARNGRWVKTVKPQFTDAGWIDASFMTDPAVTFLATVDEQGNVVRVQRYRSSGSDNIDLPCEEALNQWKIEPSRDANGHSVRDVVSVTFALQR